MEIEIDIDFVVVIPRRREDVRERTKTRRSSPGKPGLSDGGAIPKDIGRRRSRSRGWKDGSRGVGEGRETKG